MFEHKNEHKDNSEVIRIDYEHIKHETMSVKKAQCLWLKMMDELIF